MYAQNREGPSGYKKECTRLVAASDKVYQSLAHGRRFSPGTPASSTNKTDRHDIAEILMKVVLKHQKFITNQNLKIVKRVEQENYITTTDSHNMIRSHMPETGEP